MARRGGLGRGLGALIPPESTANAASSLREVPVGSISPNSNQPRQHFDEEALSSLVASVRTLGVLQPLLVREVGEGSYELIAGERRWRAARRAGLSTVPAVVRDVDELASLEQSVVENLHRQDLNPLEEAAAYQQLVEDFGLTHDQLATRVGKSRAAVSNTLRLFQLPPAIQRHVAENRLSAGHARALLGTPDRALQEALAERTVAEGLSVRAVEQEVRARSAPPPEPQKPDPAPDPVSPPDRTPPVDAIGPAGVTKLRHPGMHELEELLAEHLDTNVRVEEGARRGRIIIDFADLADLERIYRAMTEVHTSMSGRG